MTAEAKVRVGLEGLQEGGRGLRDFRKEVDASKKALQDLGQGTRLDRLAADLGGIKGAVKGSDLARDFGQVKAVADGLGLSLSSMVQSADRAGRAVLGVTDVDITGAKRRYAELDDSIARLAVTGGRSVAELKQQIRDLANTRSVAEKEIVESTARIAGETRNVGLSADIQPILVEEQKRTGRPREAIDRFAVKAVNELGVKSPAALERLFATTRDIAQATQFPGGGAGLQDALAGTDLRNVKITGEADRNKLVALAAQAGRGLPFAQAQQAAQGLIGGLAGLDLNMLVRTLGPDSKGIVDEYGRRDIPAIAEKLKARYERRFKTRQQRIGAMVNELGDQAMGAGLSLFRVDTGATGGLAAGTTSLPGVPINLEDEEAVYDANQRGRQQVRDLRGRTRYDQTEAGQRRARDAQQQNFETHQIGERAQRTEDTYKRNLSPGARMILEGTVGQLPGAAAVGAAAMGMATDHADEVSARRAGGAARQIELSPGTVNQIGTAAGRGAAEAIGRSREGEYVNQAASRPLN